MRRWYEVEMFEEQNCQMPHDESVQAMYAVDVLDTTLDAKTHLGPWAYLCKACFERFTPGITGEGRGQELVYPGDSRSGSDNIWSWDDSR